MTSSAQLQIMKYLGELSRILSRTMRPSLVDEDANNDDESNPWDSDPDEEEDLPENSLFQLFMACREGL